MQQARNPTSVSGKFLIRTFPILPASFTLIFNLGGLASLQFLSLLWTDLQVQAKAVYVAENVVQIHTIPPPWPLGWVSSVGSWSPHFESHGINLLLHHQRLHTPHPSATMAAAPVVAVTVVVCMGVVVSGWIRHLIRRPAPGCRR